MTVDDPSNFDPSKKLTEPVGALETGATDATVAVKVTGWPIGTRLGWMARVVVVVAYW